MNKMTNAVMVATATTIAVGEETSGTVGEAVDHEFPEGIAAFAGSAKSSTSAEETTKVDRKSATKKVVFNSSVVHSHRSYTED